MSEKIKFTPEEEAENIVFEKQKKDEEIVEQAKKIIYDKKKKMNELDKLDDFFKKAKEKREKIN